MKTQNTKFLRRNGLLSIILLVTSFTMAATQADTPDGPPPSPVQVDAVTKMDLQATVDLAATVQSKMHMDITAGVSGQVEWLAEPGAFVRKGDELVKMDMIPFKLELAEQKAQLKRAQINANYLNNEVQRLAPLSQSNAASQFQLEQAKSQRDLALADLEIAELRLKRAEDQFSRATIVAPYDGIVTSRRVLPGTDVNRSETLGTFLDTLQLEARVYVPLKYLGFLQSQSSSKLVVHNGDHAITSEMTAIIPNADPRSQTFEVRVAIPNDSDLLWASGQQVKISVPVQHSEPALTVHRDALILRRDGTYVVKIGTENQVERVKVTTGAGTKNRVSVTGELANGDLVAIRGAERLRDGQTVVIQSEETTVASR